MESTKFMRWLWGEDEGEHGPPTLSLRLGRLPSGVEKLMDSRCRATIGIVSNPNHGARKLRKAGQSRILVDPRWAIAPPLVLDDKFLLVLPHEEWLAEHED
ncbi:hypothetical protein F8388_017968 (mitochondrion) [Cannabis sativa]|uniref:Large ribosomal subunit protein uL2 C-terminal domain-containing protein n=1 Tax=Cannabis sativa TaxID=3483 RepID=A0A7J6DMI3_CANSA|nr:hypothetical protein F8388_017968 [Cannabis sativa]